MAAEGLEEEVKQIFELIDDNKNFLLSGGAGSGKTYSLVSVVNEIYNRNPIAKIACITYTNAAVHEIENRVLNKKIRISTIHDFLWDNISSFQNELKEALIEGINDPKVRYKNIRVEIPYSNEFKEGVKYTEYLRLADGCISHDEIIVLANQMFKKYSKLCDILNSKYDYILVDEYQDAFPEVIEILLEFLQRDKKRSLIGFFGDSMQSIYDDGIGDLNAYIEKRIVAEVQKKQNRRNPQSVMNLSNKLRIDELNQVPSEDKNAPNMEKGKVKQGTIKFVYGGVLFEDLKRDKKYFDGWNFSNPKETKELHLTNNLIASNAGFPTLMKIYDKDPLLKFKNQFITHIKENMVDIDETTTFGDVINSVDWRFSNQVRDVNNRGRKKIEVFLEDDENAKYFNLVKDKPFSWVKRIYFDKDNLISDKKEIDEQRSAQSKRDKLIRHLFKIQTIIELYETKHYNEFIRKTSFRIKKLSDKKEIKEKIDTIVGMKKSKINEVISYAHESGLCLMDDGKWNDYNFEYLFNPSHPKCNKSVLLRTQKLFYVCCTRAMKNLVVYCKEPTDAMIETAEKWFGKKNCKKI